MPYVLLVDDDEDLRDAVQCALEEAGHEVVTAANGLLAMDVLEEREPPRAALIDVRMPVMDGMELVEKMRESERLAGVRLFLMSAGDVCKPPPGVTVLDKMALRTQITKRLMRQSYVEL